MKLAMVLTELQEHELSLIKNGLACFAELGYLFEVQYDEGTNRLLCSFDIENSERDCDFGIVVTNDYERMVLQHYISEVQKFQQADNLQDSLKQIHALFRQVQALKDLHKEQIDKKPKKKSFSEKEFNNLLKTKEEDGDTITMEKPIRNVEIDDVFEDNDIPCECEKEDMSDIDWSSPDDIEEYDDYYYESDDEYQETYNIMLSNIRSLIDVKDINKRKSEIISALLEYIGDDDFYDAVYDALELNRDNDDN